MKITARCHCGAIVLEADLTDSISSARRCNCSFCARRQGANVSASGDSVRVVQGEDQLRLYSFGTHTAQHYFCGTCGIYTHHQRRTKPDEVGINIGCIDGVDPFAYEPVAWADGRSLTLDM